ncbi:MAG: GFA family protein [Pseudomonadales bacterium]
MTSDIKGGCFCGRVQYAIADEAYLSADCHCTLCRRIHAAPFVRWLVVPADRFRYLGDAPAELRSSATGTRYFCPHCGTHVACITAAHPDVVDVALGSLEAPERFPATVEVFTDTRLHARSSDCAEQPIGCPANGT